MDDTFKEKAFQHLLPTGKLGWKSERPVKITPKKYSQRRLLDVDPRFAQDVEYLFVTQTIVEIKQIQDSMSVALKKAHRASQAGKRLTAGVIRDSISLKQSISRIRLIDTYNKSEEHLHTGRGYNINYWQQSNGMEF